MSTENKQNSEQKKVTFKPVFKSINLSKVKKGIVLTKTPKVKIPVKKKASSLDIKFADVKPVTENFVFNIQENSIKEYLTQCHPDIKKLVADDNIASVKALTHGLVVTTKDKLRISIDTISRFERAISITRKKELLFKGISVVSFVKQN